MDCKLDVLFGQSESLDNLLIFQVYNSWADELLHDDCIWRNLITVYSAEYHLAADYFCDVLKLKNSQGSLSLEVDLNELDWTLVATV